MRTITISFINILFFQICIGQNIEPVLAEYYHNSTIQSNIMGYVTAEGDMICYAFGPSKWGGSDTVSADNLFRIASMTKPITSVAALQLVERDLVTLDEPLNQLLPEMSGIPILNENGKLSKSDKAITLRQLLTHTAGFAYDFTSSLLSEFNSENWEYMDQPRIFEPGTFWRYGTNTYWIGKVIEKVSKKDLETFIRSNITRPLQMNRTWFNVPDSLVEDIVSYGTRDSAGNYVEYSRSPTETVTDFRGDAGLYSTLHDYLTFLKCILNYGKYNGGRILKKETVEMMLQDQLPQNIKLIWEGANNNLPAHVSDFLDESDRWSFIGAYENNEKENIRDKGAVWWCGIYNTYFTIDIQNKFAVVYLSQLFPTVDKERYNFYRLFEKEVYSLME